MNTRVTKKNISDKRVHATNDRTDYPVPKNDRTSISLSPDDAAIYEQTQQDFAHGENIVERDDIKKQFG